MLASNPCKWSLRHGQLGTKRGEADLTYNFPRSPDSDFRREFLKAASARRWVGAGEHVHLKSQEISTAPAQHMAACGGMLACAMGKVGS